MFTLTYVRRTALQGLGRGSRRHSRDLPRRESAPPSFGSRQRALPHRQSASHSVPIIDRARKFFTQ
jgi:hypothetical protein